MKYHLIEMESTALRLKNNGDLKGAIELFTTIVKEQPDWEHGMAFYNLACCYEDLGEYAMAEKYYNNALHYEPKNTYYLGGLASFHLLHGDIDKALAYHLSLLEIEKNARNEQGIKAVISALQFLGNKSGISEKDLAQKIDLVLGK